MIEQAMRMNNVEIYLVGGAVRDELLKLPVRERDWVVIEPRRTNCWRAVSGRSARIFRCSCTRTPTRSMRWPAPSARPRPVITGFSVHAAPEVTLEDDLRRRDLTINAMARDADGHLIDLTTAPAISKPAGCATSRRLSPRIRCGFSASPVSAPATRRWAFRVAPETLDLMRAMVAKWRSRSSGAGAGLDGNSAPLNESRSERFFFETLRDCGALARIFPELDRLFGVPQPPVHHPEIDTGIHTLMALAQAARLGADTVTRFAVLVHDLGKGTTRPRNGHIIMVMNSAAPIWSGRSASACGFHICTANWLWRPLATTRIAIARWSCVRKPCSKPCWVWTPAQTTTLRTVPPGLQKPMRVADWDWRTRDYPQADLLRRVHQATVAVQARPLVQQGLSGLALAEALRRNGWRRSPRRDGPLKLVNAMLDRSFSGYNPPPYEPENFVTPFHPSPTGVCRPARLRASGGPDVDPRDSARRVRARQPFEREHKEPRSAVRLPGFRFFITSSKQPAAAQRYRFRMPVRRAQANHRTACIGQWWDFEAREM